MLKNKIHFQTLQKGFYHFMALWCLLKSYNLNFSSLTRDNCRKRLIAEKYFLTLKFRMKKKSFYSAQNFLATFYSGHSRDGNNKEKHNFNLSYSEMHHNKIISLASIYLHVNIGNWHIYYGGTGHGPWEGARPRRIFWLNFI